MRIEGFHHAVRDVRFSINFLNIHNTSSKMLSAEVIGKYNMLLLKTTREIDGIVKDTYVILIDNG